MVLQGSAVACVLISLHASQAAHAVPFIGLPPASLCRAAEALLAAALRNPRNLKFLIMSESDLPLYSPEVLYRQVSCTLRLGRVAALQTVWCFHTVTLAAGTHLLKAFGRSWGICISWSQWHAS